MKLLFLVIALALPFAVFGIDEDAVKEKQCDIPTPSVEQVGLNLNWMQSIPAFYIPFWSKLFSQRLAGDLLEKPVADIKDEQVDGVPACTVMHKNNIISGFGQQRIFNISGDNSSLTFRAPWDGAKSAKFSFHLTDNLNFILGVACWEDNESTWALLSVTPHLDPAIRQRVLKYVVSLGFKEEHAKDETFITCPAGVVLLSNLVIPPAAVAVPVVPTTRYYYSSYQPVYYSYNTLPLGYYKKK